MKRRRFVYHLKEYFHFTTGERIGIITLLIISFLIMVVYFLLPYVVKDNTPLDISFFEKQIQQYKQKTDSIEVAKHAVAHKKITIKTNPSITRTLPHKSPVIVELNSADSLALVSLPGIGPVLAHRILRYRNLLGGFYHPTQLQEVFGLNGDNLKNCTQCIIVDSQKIQRIEVNAADFKSINAHPYITYEQTQKIFTYRRYTVISSVEHLKSMNVFSDNELDKVRPYLKFD